MKEPVCYFCQKPVDAEDYCFGCHQHVCSDPECKGMVNYNMPLGPHPVELHAEEPED